MSTGADALAKIRAGAQLVQLYTAFAYAGPALVPRIKRELAAALRREGFRSVAEAVGTAHEAPGRGWPRWRRQYDGFILDLWGVIHDGVRRIRGRRTAWPRCGRRASGCVLLSNAPRRAEPIGGSCAAWASGTGCTTG